MKMFTLRLVVAASLFALTGCGESGPGATYNGGASAAPAPPAPSATDKPKKAPGQKAVATAPLKF